MEDLINKVKEFNKVMGAYQQDQPANIPHEVLVLRRKQLREEIDEYFDAVIEGDIEHIAKELGDILYMAVASVLDHGLQDHLGLILDEIHRSNMSKRSGDGKIEKNENGKILKGQNFSPADLSFVKKPLLKNPYACYGDQKPHPMDFNTREEYEERMINWQKWEAEHNSSILLPEFKNARVMIECSACNGTGMCGELDYPSCSNCMGSGKVEIGKI